MDRRKRNAIAVGIVVGAVLAAGFWGVTSDLGLSLSIGIATATATAAGVVGQTDGAEAGASGSEE